MLDQQDIKQIQGVVTGALDAQLKVRFEENNAVLTKEIVVQVGEFITDRVLPQIDALSKEVAVVKQEVASIKKTVTTLPTRDDLTRGLAEVKGVLVGLMRKEEQKMELLIKFLRDRNVLTEEQCRALREIELFPSIENLAV